MIDYLLLFTLCTLFELLYLFCVISYGLYRFADCII